MRGAFTRTSARLLNSCKLLYDNATKLGKAVKSYYTYDHILSLNPKIIKMLLQRRKLAKSLIKDEADYVSKFNEFENEEKKNETNYYPHLMS